ncbi:MAG: zinc ABC transporter substrate-binding protein [Boseongicola sp.]|nr:zinc ABC transporter substrate-binding protein [Boseongicola sp.]NNJ69535.1 zinc ABC transporter solute-binding protein [Boseongicola sp.]
MRHFRIALGTLVLGLPSTAIADAPRVVTDIAPVHSLVAQIMDGVGAPELLLPASASPHDYSLRPSDARILQEADAVFWVGDGLTPWLSDTLATLSSSAVTIELLEVEGTIRHEFRDGTVFAEEAGGHDHNHDHDHSHDHEEGHDHDDHNSHDHSGVDPHAWLDPENASVWLTAIASELSTVDPDNASSYQRNLDAARREMEVLIQDLENDLQPVASLRFVVLHDAYRYFEDRFGMRAIGAISASDATAPSAGRVREIRDAIKEQNVACLLTEVQLNAPLVDVIAGETDVTVATLDPLGAQLVPGKNLYREQMKGIANAFRACM